MLTCQAQYFVSPWLQRKNAALQKFPQATQPSWIIHNMDLKFTIRRRKGKQLNLFLWLLLNLPLVFTTQEWHRVRRGETDEQMCDTDVPLKNLINVSM